MKVQLKQIEERVKSFLELNSVTLPSSVIKKPRAVAEAFESLLLDNFESILGDLGTNCKPSVTAKATADVSYIDSSGKHIAVDIKTHCMGKWGMPNLISYKKLAKLYDDDDNVFVVLLIDYKITGNCARIVDVIFTPIENLSWDCLAIQGTLGQVQIKNAEKIVMNDIDRDAWMTEFCSQAAYGIETKMSSLALELQLFEALYRHWEEKACISSE
jgi:hypothetical protein